jgi:hypothetical protein
MGDVLGRSKAQLATAKEFRQNLSNMCAQLRLPEQKAYHDNVVKDVINFLEGPEAYRLFTDSEKDEMRREILGVANYHAQWPLLRQ